MSPDALSPETSPVPSAPPSPATRPREPYGRDLEARVGHREAVLAAIGDAATRFLGPADWERDVEDILGRLGSAVEASRVYLFETVADDRGVVRASIRHEWTAPGVRRAREDPDVHNLPQLHSGLANWAELEQGRMIHGPVRRLQPAEREYFTQRGILSLAVMPVFAGRQWWGFLGFADEAREREWPSDLLDVLRAAATTLGAALDRKRMEEEIRASEERFRRLTEATVEGVFIHDQGVVLDANPALARMFGYEVDEIIGENIIELVAAPESREVILQHMRSASTARYEAVGRRKDGSLLIGELTARATTYNGRPARVATIHDITERKRVEQELRQREAQLAAAQAIAHLGSWEWELASDSIVWSDELYRIYGFEPGAIRVTPPAFLDRIHPDDRPRVEAYVARALEDGGVQTSEHRIVRADGSVRIVRDQGRVVTDAAGRPVRVVGTVQDVTVRKEAEERERQLISERAARAAAERAEQRARFLAEASRVLGASFDYQTTLGSLVRLAVPDVADYAYVDFIRDGMVLRGGVAHVDASKESLLSAAADMTCCGPPEAHLLHAALIGGESLFLPTGAASILSEGIGNDDYRNTWQQLRPHSLVAVPLRSADRILGVLALFTAESGRTLSPDDVSVAEELARRASLAVENALLFHEAQQATRARDDMLGVVAHDLRNPLGTIRMAADATLAIGLGPEQTQARKHMDIIRRAADRMNRLIQDLLDVRRQESGRLSVDPRPMSVDSLFAEAAELLGPLATGASLALEFDVPPALPRVRADTARIQQVLSNLVGNAIKFTPAGGRVRVSAELVGDEVRFCVRDTGPGIPADQLPHIFGHFWQAQRGDQRGIGLGLAIAKGFVEAHRGRIWAESRVNEGSAFFFTLPVARDDTG